MSKKDYTICLCLVGTSVTYHPLTSIHFKVKFTTNNAHWATKFILGATNFIVTIIRRKLTLKCYIYTLFVGEDLNEDRLSDTDI